MIKLATKVFDKYPKKVSVAAKNYIDASSSTLKLFVFFNKLVISADYTEHIVKNALAGEGVDKNLSPEELIENAPGKNIKFLREMSQEILELFFSRIVDGFEIYLVDILREVLKKKPEILSNKQQSVTIEYVLRFPNKDELVTDLIESKVSSLSYKGFSDLVSWFKERGIPLKVKGEHTEKIAELIATRNVIVHNRGRVDAKYLRSNPSSDFSLGSVRKLDVPYYLEALSLLNSLVASTDIEVVGKFSLETVSRVSKTKKQTLKSENK